MNKFKKIIYILVISLLANMMLITMSYADAASDYGFDFMETFDDLQNWRGTSWSASNAQIGIESYPNDFPKKLDGSRSIWTGYTFYATADSGDYWIKNHGAENVWGGTGKSLCMDISGGNDNCGPSRMITYFGKGTRTSGYNDIYIFFMAKIYPDQWPTSIVNGVGTYVAGNPYAWWSSWKFFTITHGFEATWKHGDGSLARPSYGWHQWNTHLQLYNNSIVPKIEGWYEGTDKESGVNDNWVYGSKVPAIVPGEWFGIEVHYQLGTPGTNSGTEELWIYDKKGNATLVYSRNDLYVQHSKLAGDKFNKFWIGGNNSDVYSWGSGMKPEYYIDDFVINGSRIGPKYFAKKLGLIDIMPPGSPKDPK